MYADDSTVTSTAKTTEEINGHLNTDMKEITKWCVENHMSANAIKTKSFIFFEVHMYFLNYSGKFNRHFSHQGRSHNPH